MIYVSIDPSNQPYEAMKNPMLLCRCNVIFFFFVERSGQERGQKIGLCRH